MLVFFFINKKDKVEHYYWFRKMPSGETITPTPDKLINDKQIKSKKKDVGQLLHDKIGYYYRELNTQFEDIGPIDKKHWYIKIPCPKEIKDMYKIEACKQGKCAFFLVCYKRI